MKNSTPLPLWLTKAENYSPSRDKDAFIDKSILTVFAMLSRIKAQGSRSTSGTSAHAEIKLPVTLLLIVLVSVSRSFPFVLVILVGLLCRLAVMRAEDILAVLMSSVIASVFTALVLLPAALLGNWYSIVMITPKVFASVTAAALLSHGTRWNDLTGAVKVFFLPDLFIFVLDITVKYILLLGDFALNMLYALRLRSVGRNNRKHASLSGVAGTMFIKSGEMATELHAAMECRGFTGEYHRPARFFMNALDAAALATAALVVLLFIFIR